MRRAATYPEVGEILLSSLSTVGVVIPTYNAARHWEALRRGLDAQGLSPRQILIIDSSSRDATRELAAKAGYQVICIEQRDFNHGGTRQAAIRHVPWAELLIYLTQDAVLIDPSAFQRLHKVFADPLVGAAYGRQLPREDAGSIERHARHFNYPTTSSVRTYASREALGIKAAFLSNSFAAYRRSVLEAVGGFPANVIMAEDSVVAARMLMAGWKVAYVADAAVVHSHPLSAGEEFRRYFDTGVHHAREHWIQEAFGRASNEGKRFLRSELSYLRVHDAGLIPAAALRTLGKLVAYHLGLRERLLPPFIRARLSLQPRFWDRT